MNDTRLTMPNAPMARSPPWVCNPLFISMTMKQEATFIRKGARPIDKESRAILESIRKMPRCRRTTSFLPQRMRMTQMSDTTCANIVAMAAPRMPHPKPKMKRGSSMAFSTTVTIVAAIA